MHGCVLDEQSAREFGWAVAETWQIKNVRVNLLRQAEVDGREVEKFSLELRELCSQEVEWLTILYIQFLINPKRGFKVG